VLGWLRPASGLEVDCKLYAKEAVKSQVYPRQTLHLNGPGILKLEPNGDPLDLAFDLAMQEGNKAASTQS
jgi:hypothetical protein